MGVLKKQSTREKKQAYDRKLCTFLDQYTRVLVVEIDNVGSTQLAAVRRGIRGQSEMIMGKNTLIRRCINVHAEKSGNDRIKSLIPLIRGNVGLIFTNADLKEVCEEIGKYKVGAPARVGLVSQTDVVVPPGNTGLDPSQTSFFQVLNIPTKIMKGSVEIVAPVDLIKKGDKVGPSEAALLSKLGIQPFTCSLVVKSVYDDGSVFSPEVLDLTDEDLMEKFISGVNMIASLSLALSYPSMAAAPHMFLNGYKNVLAFAIATDYSYPHADQIKQKLNYRDWTTLPDHLLEFIFDRMEGGTFAIMRGPKNVCLSWRNTVLWYVFGDLFEMPNQTVDDVVEAFRRTFRSDLHSEAGSSEHEYYDMFDEELDEPEEGAEWYFTMYIKDLKKFAAAVLSC